MEWRPISEIPGYEEFTNYVLNIAGELRNVKTGNILKWRPRPGGYYYTEMAQAPARPKKILQHRAICCAFIPNPLNLPQVDHINRIPTDNRIGNLRWASSLENVHNRGIRINNATGEQNIYAVFNYGNPIWRVAMEFRGKKRTKSFKRDTDEIPQEVKDYRDAMKLEIQTELNNLIS